MKYILLIPLYLAFEGWCLIIGLYLPSKMETPRHAFLTALAVVYTFIAIIGGGILLFYWE